MSSRSTSSCSEISIDDIPMKSEPGVCFHQYIFFFHFMKFLHFETKMKKKKQLFISELSEANSKCYCFDAIFTFSFYFFCVFWVNVFFSCVQNNFYGKLNAMQNKKIENKRELRMTVTIANLYLIFFCSCMQTVYFDTVCNAHAAFNMLCDSIKSPTRGFRSVVHCVKWFFLHAFNLFVWIFFICEAHTNKRNIDKMTMKLNRIWGRNVTKPLHKCLNWVFVSIFVIFF